MDLPSKQELGLIQPRLIVAYAVRCAQRVLPYAEEYFSEIQLGHILRSNNLAMEFAQGSDDFDFESHGPEIAHLADESATFATKAKGKATAYWAARAAGKTILVAAAASKAIGAYLERDELTAKAKKAAIPIVPIAAVAAISGAVPIAALVAIAGTAKAAKAANAHSLAANFVKETAKIASDTASCAARAYEGYATDNEADAEYVFAATSDLLLLRNHGEESDEYAISIDLWPEEKPEWYLKLVEENENRDDDSESDEEADD